MSQEEQAIRLEKYTAPQGLYEKTKNMPFLGETGWDEIAAFDRTGCFWRRNIQEDVGFSDRHIRLRWGGAGKRDRYR